MEIEQIDAVEDDSSHVLRLKGRTIKRLKKLGMMHESFDGLVNRIITVFESKKAR